MNPDLLDRLFPLFERALVLADKWIDRKYPVPTEISSELWKQGEPLPQPKTQAEYEAFPSDQPGRFQQAIAQARKDRSA